MTDLQARDEVEPSSRGRRGAHRAAPSRLVALLPVVAVAAVVVLTVLALVFFTGLGGRGAGGDVSAGAPAATPTTSAPPVTTAPTTPSTPSTASSPPSATSPSSPGATGSSGPGDASSSTAPGVDEGGADDGAAPPPGGDAGAPDARGAPVVVLNATSTSGLAARTADDLKGEGWSISRTGDAEKGSVQATQVRYSDPSLESAAQAVAKSLGGADVRRDEAAMKGVVTVVAGPDRVGR